MKKVHYFVYGLLAGAVLVLSSVVLVQTVDQNRANAQANAATSSETAMVTAQHNGTEHILYVSTKNTKGEPVLMAYAMPQYGNLGLLAARSLKYDRRLVDFSTRRPQPPQGKTAPTYESLREMWMKRKNQNTKGGGDRR